MKDAQTVLDRIVEAREKGEIWDAYTWLEIGNSLVAFMSNEHDKLLDLNQAVQQSKLELLESGKTAAYAKIAIEASHEYVALQRQKAKLDRITETVRLAKHFARLKESEMHQ